jgi:hypothetical protein
MNALNRSHNPIAKGGLKRISPYHNMLESPIYYNNKDFADVQITSTTKHKNNPTPEEMAGLNLLYILLINTHS